jgi:hypothetical protein
LSVFFADAYRKIFCLYEVDNLIFDPVILMITKGMLDDAFRLTFTSIGDVFKKIRAENGRKTVQLKWKVDWENKPVLRQAVRTEDGWQTSDEPLRYHTLLYLLQRLGVMVGMMAILNPYNIRRGAGEAVKSKSYL